MTITIRLWKFRRRTPYWRDAECMILREGGQSVQELTGVNIA